MATIVEIENSKLEMLSEYIEKMLRYGGKAMSCIERMKEEEEEEEHEYRKSKKRSMRDKEEEEYSRYF